MISLRLFLALVVAIAGLFPLTVGRTLAGQEDGGQTVNLQIIVDSSGSMAAPTDTGIARIDSARTVLNQVISSIPDTEGVNVGFRVYGNGGDNTEAGRAESCLSSDLIVPMQGVDAEALQGAVDAVQPVGWTPLGYALEQAEGDFEDDASDDVVNAILMVTDGLETCDGDPVGTAGRLRTSDAGIVTNVIGFGTTPEEQAILSGIAEEGGGELYSSANAGQLISAIFEVLEELEVVEETGSGETRDSPLGVGRTGEVGDYEVTVLSVTPNANDLVAAENQFNEPPSADEQFFIARLSVTYTG
ncbi:MAG TPA: VWA domain-containing protein, partial [Thermomicrobiales bacterium]|nr:VWA domain-containing protein [Thermomicrobiales bacterium]